MQIFGSCVRHCVFSMHLRSYQMHLEKLSEEIEPQPVHTLTHGHSQCRFFDAGVCVHPATRWTHTIPFNANPVIFPNILTIRCLNEISVKTHKTRQNANRWFGTVLLMLSTWNIWMRWEMPMKHLLCKLIIVIVCFAWCIQFWSRLIVFHTFLSLSISLHFSLSYSGAPYHCLRFSIFCWVFAFTKNFKSSVKFSWEIFPELFSDQRYNYSGKW